MPTFTLDIIHLGDCLVVLQGIPDASIDAIVTDPPYGLGTKEPSIEAIIQYLQGGVLDTAGDFMGKDWQIPPVAVWKECYRVLKPGGHLLSFGGTRTFDLISLGIRAAGFENRDTIASMFGGVLSWLHGQGFPKSLNIGKAIDKMAGAEREVVGVKPGHEEFVNRTDAHAAGGDSEAWERPWKNDPERVAASHMQTAPATEDAKRWDGWGTALKPSWEPILVYRKPLEESTVAGQVLATGTGGLNIDATRVHTGPSTGGSISGGSAFGQDSGWNAHNNRTTQIDRSMAAGRWPSNLVLVHHPDCKRVGTAEAPAPVINRFDDGMKPFGEGAGHPYTSSGGGTEEIAVFECAEGCPVRILDEQSGESRSAGGRIGNITPSGVYGGGRGLGASSAHHDPGDHRGDPGFGDTGGASRFFPSFHGQEPPAAPFMYTSKASKRETSLDGQVENTHPCLHPDSLVMTPDGYQPIAALNVGSHVLSADGHFHTVEAVTQHPYTSETLVEIGILGSNIASLVSDNHPYLIWRPTRHCKGITGGVVQWLRADEVVVGDYTMTPIVLDGLVGVTPPRAEDTEFWFLVGLYLAEGWTQKAGHGDNGYPRFALHKNETDLIDRLRMYCSNVQVSVYPNGENGVTVLPFDPELGVLFAELCGSGAATKRLHPCVWNLPEDSLNALVEGYFAGDGGQVRTYLQAKTSSPHVGSQMRFLGEMLGYKVELQWCAPEPGGIGEREFKTVLPYYVIRMNLRNRTIQGRKPSRPTVLEHEGVTYLLSYVKRLNRVPYVGDVVNLSVEGSHTFQTAAGMSHNTKKPLALMEWLVKLVCPKGGTVLDPYCGSGTTCVAATANDMHFVGIERDEQYHAIAVRRAGIVFEECEHERGLKSVFERMEELAEELDDGGDIYADLHKHS